MPNYEYECKNCGIIEIFHGIKEDAKTVCPQCNSEGLERKISAIGGFVFKGRQANQYSDIKSAKYWRDVNGDLHPVTPADGDVNSATVKNRKLSPEAVEAKKKQQKQMKKKLRREKSYQRYVNEVKTKKRQ